MTEEEQILFKSGERIVQEMKAQIDEKGLNNTGRAKHSLSFEVKGSILQINGLLRVAVLITGRKKGEFPKVEDIRGWVETKLGITEERERNQVAFLIGRKIAEKGTDIFTNRYKGIQIEIILSKVTFDLFEEISVQSALSVTNAIFEAYTE